MMTDDDGQPPLPSTGTGAVWRYARAIALFVLVFAGQLAIRHYLIGHQDDHDSFASRCQAAATPVAAVSVASPVPTLSFPGPIGATCLRIAPGDTVRTPANRVTFILSVESGRVSVRFTHPVTIGHTGTSGSRAVTAGAEATVKRGDTVYAVTGSDGLLRNDGDTDAVFLLIVT